MAQVLKVKNDADVRADSGIRTAAKTGKSVIPGMKSGPKPGAYGVIVTGCALPVFILTPVIGVNPPN